MLFWIYWTSCTYIFSLPCTSYCAVYRFCKKRMFDWQILITFCLSRLRTTFPPHFFHLICEVLSLRFRSYFSHQSNPVLNIPAPPHPPHHNPPLPHHPPSHHPDISFFGIPCNSRAVTCNFYMLHAIGNVTCLLFTSRCCMVTWKIHGNWICYW